MVCDDVVCMVSTCNAEILWPTPGTMKDQTQGPVYGKLGIHPLPHCYSLVQLRYRVDQCVVNQCHGMV